MLSKYLQKKKKCLEMKRQWGGGQALPSDLALMHFLFIEISGCISWATSPFQLTRGQETLLQK